MTGAEYLEISPIYKLDPPAVTNLTHTTHTIMHTHICTHTGSGEAI